MTDNVETQEKMKYGRGWVPLNTSVVWIAAKMRPEKLYDQKLLIPKTGGRFLTAG